MEIIDGASVKEGLRGFLSLVWSWIFIDASVKERGNILIVGFPRVARPGVYFEEYWSIKLRWKRTKKGYLTMVWSWIFIDISVNFGVYQRLIRRRLGVDSSFTSGVRVRTTTTCTPSATITTSCRAVVVQRHGRRRMVLLLSNKVTYDDRTVV